jgi:RNA polymerase sigma factor (sigma-70 family)
MTTEAEFAARAERHRRELHVHCYRMMGSFEEAEDLVQETLLRAWRNRGELEQDQYLRAWLYKIATNACLDTIKASKRRVPSLNSFGDVPWLQPYPDALLPADEEPDAALFARETIELTFLAVIQLLPPRQRAVLVLRDVLDWPAKDVAELLEIGVAAVNSALQRARDTRITMPPYPLAFEGREAMLPLLERAFGPEAGEWRLVPTRANRMPAAASYHRAPGDDTFRKYKLDVLRVRDGKIAEITTFGSALFRKFGLPETL